MKPLLLCLVVHMLCVVSSRSSDDRPVGRGFLGGGGRGFLGRFLGWAISATGGAGGAIIGSTRVLLVVIGLLLNGDNRVQVCCSRRRRWLD